MAELQLESLCTALRELCCAEDINAASTVVEKLLSQFSTLVHASIWGNDERQRRVFFAHRFLDRFSTDSYPSQVTLEYDGGLLGKCAATGKDQFFTESDIPSLVKSQQVRDLLLARNIRSGGCLKIPSPTDYPCSGLFLFNDTDHASLDGNIERLKNLSSGFISAYAKDEVQRFRELESQIVKAKVTKEGIDFLKNACDAFARVFSATTFSVWMVEGDNLVSKYFSQPRADQRLVYHLGEGLTGHVAKTGKPIFLHVLTDSKRVYGVKWAGRHSDYPLAPPDKNDHMMIVPLIYPKGIGLIPTVNGVLRFVGIATHPSFWPVNFVRAQSIAELLSVLLYQEILLKNEKDNSKTLKNLLTLVYKAKASGSVQDIGKDFLEEISQWPGVKHIALAERARDGTYNFESCTFLNATSIDQCKSLLATDSKSDQHFDTHGHIWPVHDQKNQTQFAALIGYLDNQADPNCGTWVQLAGQILGNFYAINSLSEEKQRLMADNQRKEMEALAGAVARSYAHEVINGCKDLKSWAINAQRKNQPNYNVLLARVKEMFDHVNELLGGTGFLKPTKRVCVLNTELEYFLSRLGLRHGTRREGCEIKLDIVGHPHRHVYIDPNTFIGIVQNLVINAQEQYISHKRSGPIEIRIVEKPISNKLYVGFAVTDYAVGIPEESQTLIWEYGYTTKEGGKGIGLAIVKHLVEECGGVVSVSSTLGHYTTFTILYPVENQDGGRDN